MSDLIAIYTVVSQLSDLFHSRETIFFCLAGLFNPGKDPSLLMGAHCYLEVEQLHGDDWGFGFPCSHHCGVKEMLSLGPHTYSLLPILLWPVQHKIRLSRFKGQELLAEH